MSRLAMGAMFDACIHIGHRTSYWNPKMANYIYGTYDKLHIINLEKSLPMLRDALNFLGNVAANGGNVLFVGTKWAARRKEVIREQAQRCGMPYVDHRWLGGMLTNYRTIKNSIRRLKDLQEMVEKGKMAQMSKKEALSHTRELEKLERALGGIRDMAALPDALFVVDVGFEHIAICEANKLRIPVVGIVDTNNSPEGVDYVIPGNDDASSAIEFYAKAVADAILDARESASSGMMGEEAVVDKAVEAKKGAVEQEAE